MKKYRTFAFDSYDYNEENGEMELNYSLDDELKFCERITLPVLPTPLSTDKLPSFKQAMLALHIAGGPSYFKTCCPKNIEVRSDKLSEKQAMFWHDVFENGLGEFFYRNDIDFRDLIRFPVDREEPPPLKSIRSKHETPHVLVPIGGGKDSMVTIELLRNEGVDITLLRVGEHPAIDELAKITGLPILNIKRQLSPLLFDLNAQGALNGHVPITAYISCLSIVLAILYDFDAVVFSNERSADEGNNEFHGMEINHQWSKSLDFEEDFQSYLRTFVSPDVSYFSLLRPLSELHIGKIFARFPEYFSRCTSCNANWRIIKEKPDQKWCCVCPKCAFVFAILSAFIDEVRLTDMFGGSPYENEELLPLFKQLLGQEGFKPFECVGTPEETQAAMYLAHKSGSYSDTPIMKYFASEVLPTIKNPDLLVTEALTPSDRHAIPAQYLPKET